MKIHKNTATTTTINASSTAATASSATDDVVEISSPRSISSDDSIDEQLLVKGQIKHELSQYKKLLKDLESDDPVLGFRSKAEMSKFWFRQKELPKLRAIYLFCATVPSSNAILESSFSYFKQNQSPNNNSLNEKYANSMFQLLEKMD